jgi:hypothetical protein
MQESYVKEFLRGSGVNRPPPPWWGSGNILKKLNTKADLSKLFLAALFKSAQLIMSLRLAGKS